MSSVPSFLIYTSAIQNEPGFILACSDDDLRWLASLFQKLATTGRFALGDGHPIYSDHKCAIEVSANSDHEAQAELASIREGHFHWAIPLRQADQYAGMIDAMADSPEPCHQ